MKQPIVRMAQDRPIGAWPLPGPRAFVSATDAAGFARAIAARWRTGRGRVSRADIALSAMRRAVAIGSVRQQLRFDIHLSLQQTLRRQWDRPTERLTVSGKRMPVALRLVPRTDRADARQPPPPVSPRPNLIPRTTTMPPRWLPAMSARVWTQEPVADRSRSGGGRLAPAPMTQVRRVEAIELMERRAQRKIRSAPPLEMRVRRDLPPGPMQAQPPFGSGDWPIGQDRQPRPVAQTPNVRHLADEVLAIIDRRATAARERLERR